MIKILIIEDEFLIANLIKDSLTSQGYTCKCLLDGEAAASELETATYDLVLLDVMLPKIDGFELITYIDDGLGGDFYPVSMSYHLVDTSTLYSDLKELARNFWYFTFQQKYTLLYE